MTRTARRCASLRGRHRRSRYARLPVRARQDEYPSATSRDSAAQRTDNGVVELHLACALVQLFPLPLLLVPRFLFPFTLLLGSPSA